MSLDIAVENENEAQEASLQNINFTNTDLSIDQVIEVREGTTVEDVLAGLNSGELTTSLDHGSEEQYITNSGGEQFAKIVAQEVTIIGAGFSNYKENNDE